MRFFSFFTAAFGLALLPVAHGVETVMQARERSLAGLRDLAGQFRLEVKISEEEVDAGVARGEWTAEEARSGKRWVQETVAPAMEARASTSAFLGSVTEFGSAVAFLRSRLSPRLEALLRYRQDLSSDLLVSTDRAVTAIWLTAKMREDLQPAVRLLDETLAEFKPTVLTEMRSYVTNSPPSPERQSLIRSDPRFAPIDRFKDFYSIIHPDPPFLLPDPAVDPAGFRVMWRYYVALQHDSMHSFFQDRGVQERIRSLESQYKENEKSAWAAVEKAFQDNASAKITAAALERAAPYAPLPLFEISPNAPQPGSFPRTATPTPPKTKPGEKPDYRTTAEPWLDRSAEQNEGRLTTRQQMYQEWIAFRRAQEAGDSGEVAKFAEKFRQNLRGYPTAFANHVREQLKQIPLAKP